MGLLAVAHDPMSAAYVRRSIAADLETRGVGSDCVDDVVLVASELVANAVLHTATNDGSELDISWDVEPEAVVVRVLDESPTLPKRRNTSDGETSGRGLFIVAALAQDWGVRRTNNGKQVWARIPTVRAVEHAS